MQTRDSVGSLLERTLNGAEPVILAENVSRTFLQDGDEVVLSGVCKGNGITVGFGECRGRIKP